MLKRYRVRNFDLLLVILVVSLNIIGIFAIGSAKESVQDKQIFGMLTGLCMMMAAAFVDYSKVLKLHWLWYILMIGLLLLVHFFGDTVNGAKRWLDLGFIQFQPSETTKILLILFYAQFIMKYKEKLNTFRILFLTLLLAVPPIYLVFDQPDLSTTILITVVFCAILFVGGLSWKIIGTVLAVALPAMMVFLTIIMQEDQTLIKPYQRNRIMAFIDPVAYADAEAYQQINSVIAICSGQLFGKGLNNNEIASVKNGNFLPEPQTDFIFAVIGEEMGVVGTSAVIVLIILIAIRCVMIARTAKDAAGMIIAAGIGTLVGVQGFMNIAVATQMMPNTGLPLPFVSYGVTSLWCLYTGIGVVLNVRLQRRNLYNL